MKWWLVGVRLFDTATAVYCWLKPPGSYGASHPTERLYAYYVPVMVMFTTTLVLMIATGYTNWRLKVLQWGRVAVLPPSILCQAWPDSVGTLLDPSLSGSRVGHPNHDHHLVCG